MTNDPTGKRLFFQLLHAARGVRFWPYQSKHNYLYGMWQTLKDNREDFTIADNMRDYWKCQQSGAD